MCACVYDDRSNFEFNCIVVVVAHRSSKLAAVTACRVVSPLPYA